LILLAGLALVAVGLLLTGRSLWAQTLRRSDLIHDHEAAQALLDGESAYSVDYNHPPFAAVAFVPLAFLSYPAAVYLWGALSVLCYFLIFHTVLTTLRIPVPRYQLPLWGGLALTWYPFLAHVSLGQWSLLVVALLIGGWAALRAGREGLAGALLALATLFKLFPGLVALYLLVRRRWAALVTMALVLLAGVLLTGAVSGVGDLYLFFFEVATENAARYAAFPVNLSITGAISRFFVDGRWIRPVVALPGVARALVLLAQGLLVLLLTLKLWRLPGDKRGDAMAFAYLSIAMILLSPISWQHILPLTLLPLALVYREVGEGMGSRARLLLLTVAVLFSLPDVAWAQALARAYAPERVPALVSALLLAPTLGLLLLWRLLDEVARSASEEG
jgi:hypothetical protein